jgi:hypothetical protein
MHRRMLRQQGGKIRSGDHIGEFDYLDVISLAQQRPTFS